MSENFHNPVTKNSQPTIEELSGHSEGEIVVNGEIIVGDYNENGTLVGWHKEVVN